MASAFGNNFWQIVALVVAMVILAFGVGKGIEKVNKVLMPVFFLLFVALGIYVAFQPGAADGYRYIFRVEPKALADPKTWIFALGQAFFSLSVAGNGTLIYGSYLSDGENIPAACRKSSIFLIRSLLCCCAGYYPGDGNYGSTVKYRRTWTSVHFPSEFDKVYAGWRADRNRFLCRCLFCRPYLSD